MNGDQKLYIGHCIQYKFLRKQTACELKFDIASSSILLMQGGKLHF